MYDYITTGGVSQYSEIQYIAGPAANNGAGESVTLSGDGTRLAIGVAFQDNSGDRGVVYIYHYDVNSSSFQYITFVRGYNLEYLGLTKGGLALNQNGHRLVIGSTDYENTGTNNRGRVLVYEYNTQTTTWNQFTQIIDEEETDRRFGSDTSITRDGSFIITSAINDDNIHGVNAGLVKVYGLPAAHGAHPASVLAPGLGPLLAKSAGCLGLGLALGLPIYGLMRWLDRGGHPHGAIVAVTAGFAANVPLVPGIPPPSMLEHIPSERIFYFTIRPGRLQELRRSRAQHLGIHSDPYADLASIRDELRHGDQICESFGCT